MYHLSHLIARDLRPHDGIPGGPRISMAYSAATAAIRAGSGGTGPAGAHELVEAAGLGHEQEAGVGRGDLERVRDVVEVAARLSRS